MSVCVGVAELSEDLQIQVPSFISCLFAQGAAGDGYAGLAKRFRGFKELLKCAT